MQNNTGNANDGKIKVGREVELARKLDTATSEILRLQQVVSALQLAAGKEIGRVVKQLAVDEKPGFWKRKMSIQSRAKLLVDKEIVQPTWYLGHHSDVAAAEMDPAIHYLLHGCEEGRLPNAFLDEVAGLKVLRIAVTSNTKAISLSLANGGREKAFIAKVRFFDRKGSLLSPPYKGFHQADELGAYFYVEGGQKRSPKTTVHFFTPSTRAVLMEIELISWRFRGAPQLSAPVKTIVQQDDNQPKHELKSQVGAASLAHLLSSPIRTQIFKHIDNKKVNIVGIIGAELSAEWGAQISDGALPFDDYESNLEHFAPTHLVIEADQLPLSMGWEHALTLRAPATTVELAVMLQKSRKANIKTVLILPKESHRFPLLSRITQLFDIILPPQKATLEDFAK